MTKNLVLRLGSMAPPIGSQLVEQGLKASRGESAERWQKDADAIARLHIRGVITWAEAKRARDRLMKKIAGNVSEVAKA